MSTRRWLPAMAVLLLASTLVLAENRQVNCDHGAKLGQSTGEGETRGDDSGQGHVSRSCNDHHRPDNH